MRIRADTLLFRIGLWIWVPFIAVGYWFYKYGYGLYHSLFSCTFYEVTGLPCPGCGGTRAFYYMFSGDIVKSFQYHPVVIYGVLAYMHFMILYYYRNYFCKDKRAALSKEISVEFYLFIAAIVTVIQWIIKLFITTHIR